MTCFKETFCSPLPLEGLLCVGSPAHDPDFIRWEKGSPPEFGWHDRVLGKVSDIIKQANSLGALSRLEAARERLGWHKATVALDESALWTSDILLLFVWLEYRHRESRRKRFISKQALVWEGIGCEAILAAVDAVIARADELDVERQALDKKRPKGEKT